MNKQEEQGLRFAIMGAGAVGCYFGGMLARAGHQVTLIGRGAHVQAIRQQGLRLDTQTFDETLHVTATTDVAAVRDAQIVLFCVKSTDTVSAAAQIAPHLDPAAIVLSLQNGVENAELLKAALPQQVIAAVVYVATEMAGPGHLRHHGRGELTIGASAASERIATLFTAAGIPVQVSDNVVGAQWAKLIINCAYNAISAITQMPYGRLMQGEGIETLMQSVVDECRAVSDAAGIHVPGDSMQEVRRIAQTMAGQFSSTAQDLARGKPNEIDHLNGYVCRQAQALGISTPVNHALTCLVKLLAEKKQETP
jgi:2-dehydropantoate 2-reductase